MFLFKIFDGIKRAFTKQPIGKFWDILDQVKGESRLSPEWVAATIVRFAFFFLFIWTAQHFGIPVEKLFDWLAQLMEIGIIQ